MKSVLKIVGVGVNVTMLFFAISAQCQTRASLQEQKMCYEQSKKVFDADAEFYASMPRTSRSFTSHYSRKMNACYMEVTTIMQDLDGTIILDGHTVMDAFENRDIGTCNMEKDNTIKDCAVFPSSMRSFKEFVVTIRRTTGLYGGGD